MYTLTESEAILLVRRNIDEQEYNDSSMADVDDKDSTAFEELCKKLLPEAINEVHANAPIDLLQGEDGSTKTVEIEVSSDNVLSFTLEDVLFLRLVRFQIDNGNSSSPEIYNAISMASPEGRMQLNPYTRGSEESPKLVYEYGGSDTFFKYCVVNDAVKGLIGSDGYSPIALFHYLPMYRYDTTGGITSYKIAERVHNNIIDQLTAKVLAVYNSAQASYFFSRAGFGVAQETDEKK